MPYTVNLHLLYRKNIIRLDCIVQYYEDRSNGNGGCRFLFNGPAQRL